jgi:hypothetical protein
MKGVDALGRLLACGFLFLPGCSSGEAGPRTYPVAGSVLFAGEPVASGRILFRNTAGDGRGYSTEIRDGRYELACEAGRMRVEITASRDIPGKFSTANPGEKVPVGEMYISKQYNEQSQLEADVQPRRNEIPFMLE